MDGSKKVMESLDSLWFFNNVLTLPSFEHKDYGVALYQDTVEEEEKPSKPKIQEAPSTEILVPKCPKCGEIAVGLEQHVVQPITEVEFARATEKGKRRRKRSKRKVLGELDLGSRCKLASESPISEETIEHSNFESPHCNKMPPLDDSLAMKEHLKSWAYAVACTVK